MRRWLTRLTSLGLAAIIIASVLTMGWPNRSEALSGSDFNPGRIIDDAVFENKNSMSVAQIQQFLNSKVPTCDNWGTQSYAGTTRRAYAEARGVTFPLTCLKDYRENPNTRENNLEGRAAPAGSQSAAEIIYNAAQQYTINPQVLLVLLQKEQALISDDWPWPVQFRKATGFGCPDTAPCDSQYFGFYNQVRKAAQQFRLYLTNPNNYNYVAQQNNTIRWNPNASCGSSTVFITNQATAALYNYTPYRPNQAALDNLYGTGDSCSSYGNRNFWRMFIDWFGSTRSIEDGVVRKLQKSTFGSTQQVFTATNNKVFSNSWWPNSGGIYRDIPFSAPFGERIVDFYKINQPDGDTQNLYVATTGGVYEVWWKGSGYSSPAKIITKTGLRRVIADRKQEGATTTHRLYTLATDGPYEYWWRSGTGVSGGYRFWQINNGIDMVKTTDASNRDEIYVATGGGVFRMKWPISGDVERRQVTSLSDTVAIDKQKMEDGTELLYTATKTGVHETWWRAGSGFSEPAKLVNLAGGPQVVDVKKTFTNGYHQLYIADKGRVHEYWWGRGRGVSGGQLLSVDPQAIVQIDKSATGDYQNVYTARQSYVNETWWGNGKFGNGTIINLK